MKVIEGSLSLHNEEKIAIVVSRTNKLINKNLLEGSLDSLKRIGKVKECNIYIIWVPGAYEIPITVNTLLKNKKCHAVIVIATIIKGCTPHYKFLMHSCNNEISKISSKELIPISFGILITENIDQAIERSGIKLNNKGADAALAVLEMINVIKNIKNI